MTLRRYLKTSKNNQIIINSDLPEIIAHFADSHNYADVIINQINVESIYDPILDEEEDLVILDIGANIGLFSLYAQDRAKIIYAIEPTPSHFEKLKELTKDYQNICLLNYAVNDTDTEIDFYIHDDNTTMNSSVNKYEKKIKIKGMTIGSIIKEMGLTHVDFVKCDIEGSEIKAITNETISEVKDIVDCWFLEIHATNPEVSWPGNLEDNRNKISQIFINQGYETQYIGHDTLYVYKNKEQ
jgi:FkbM family methyltransferase